MDSDGDTTEYYIEAVLQFVYKLKDGRKTQEIINAGMRIKVVDDVIYSIEDAYKINEDETESEGQFVDTR